MNRTGSKTKPNRAKRFAQRLGRVWAVGLARVVSRDPILSISNCIMFAIETREAIKPSDKLHPVRDIGAGPLGFTRDPDDAGSLAGPTVRRSRSFTQHRGPTFGARKLAQQRVGLGGVKGEGRKGHAEPSQVAHDLVYRAENIGLADLGACVCVGG